MIIVLSDEHTSRRTTNQSLIFILHHAMPCHAMPFYLIIPNSDRAAAAAEAKGRRRKIIVMEEYSTTRRTRQQRRYHFLFLIRISLFCFVLFWYLCFHTCYNMYWTVNFRPWLVIMYLYCHELYCTTFIIIIIVILPWFESNNSWHL